MQHYNLIVKKRTAFSLIFGVTMTSPWGSTVPLDLNLGARIAFPDKNISKLEIMFGVVVLESRSCEPPGTPSRRSPTLHIPTDNNLSSPIRHYISESLICQVLGQPSFSLTCLLVSSVVEYMGITVSLHRPITIEDICKMVRLS